jgi:hypothetical protein
MRNPKSSPAKKSGRELAETAKAMLKQGGKKILVKTVDCTPDWVRLAPLFVEWIQNGNQQQYEEAQRSIMQMARISDDYRKNQSLFKASPDMLAALKDALEILEASPVKFNGTILQVKQAIAKAEVK